MKKTELMNWEDFLPAYCAAHPELTLQDIEKLLYQGTFGGRHLMLQCQRVEAGIREELQELQDTELLQPLPGAYARVHLGYLQQTGLSPAALAKLFCRSAQRTDGSIQELEQQLDTVLALCREGKIPFSTEEAQKQFAQWKEAGYPARRHSAAYREAYHPAYRVLAKEYVRLLPLLAELENCMQQKRCVLLAIEGCAGSGKSSLAALLQELYGGEIVPVDDFFLRPEQRTPERYAQPGGNMDRERLEAEVLMPLLSGQEEICYRPFDCHTMSLRNPVHLRRAHLIIVEGSYSMHPQLERYYDLSVFLQVSPEEQYARILRRDGEEWAKIFQDRWIPLENVYFAETRAAERCRFLVEESV